MTPSDSPQLTSPSRSPSTCFALGNRLDEVRDFLAVDDIQQTARDVQFRLRQAFAVLRRQQEVFVRVRSARRDRATLQRDRVQMYDDPSRVGGTVCLLRMTLPPYAFE